MSMVVRTNSMAMNANSALNKNNSTVAGNLQKLSTGFRINRAADDASGLAVSEKMKAQIKALDQAGKNAQDGASLIKTAEGYMGEIHDMLNRIVELAEKSANGTFETKDGEKYGEAATDRQAIQDEVDQLTTEIDRIAKTANFNQLKLLDGSLDTNPSAVTESTTTIQTGWLTANDGTDVQATGEFDSSATYYIKTKDAVAATYEEPVNGSTLQSLEGDAKTQYYTKNNETGVYTQVKSTDTIANDTTPYYKLKTAGENAEYRTVTSQEIADATTTTKTFTGDPTGKALTLQIGETSNAADKLEVSIMSFKTATLFGGEGMDEITHNNESDAAKTAGFASADYQGLTINVSDQETASKAAEKVRDVINKVSAQRATLGAMENRLDYTMNNLDTASQNITDANSRIRDTDMAKTMMEYTQGNTLTQAAQAMLAQANQAPSQVLQLLQ